MAASEYLINRFLETLTGTPFSVDATYVSAHTGDPGDGGSNEVSGGSYARVAISWGSPSGKQVSFTNEPELSIPAETEVTHIGIWDAESGGNFLIGKEIISVEFEADGNLVVTPGMVTGE